MNNRLAAPVAGAAAALLLLAACSDDGPRASDDGPTTLAKGNVRFIGSTDLGGQTMAVTAVQQEGQVTGEARFSFGLVLDLQCADTDTDGFVILGGQVTAEDGDAATVGDRVAVIIREGDPDSVLVWYELPLPEGDLAAGSCGEFLDTLPHDQFTGLADIAEGDDIETG